MIKINVPTLGKRHTMRMQLSLINNIVNTRKTKEIKVLEYLLRHSNSGMYQIKRNYRSDIAKYANSTNNGIKLILRKLSSKGLITHISNQTGNNLGVYTFHPAVYAVHGNQPNITFHFVEK